VDQAIFLPSTSKVGFGMCASFCIKIIAEE
jgi:hypothetical protein